ncbi:MAG: PKD domain-containing protein [Chitinophagaceae bacterium]
MTYLRFTTTALSILFFIFFICTPTAQAQVFAGIRANGKVMRNGDTVRVCQGSTVSYQSVGSGSLNIEWTFNGGTPGTYSGVNPNPILYNTAGFDTTWQKISGGGFSDSMFIIVQVSSEKPSVSFNFGPNNVCGNEPINFNNLSTGTGLTYAWTFSPTGASTDKSPSYQFLEAVGPSGTQDFAVKLVVTNFYGCKDSVTQTVTVKKVPDASVGNADPTVSFGTFNGVPTFKKCNNIPSYNFSFTNQSSTAATNTSYVIKWGDGNPDSSFNSWPVGFIIRHTFPLGSSNMVIETTAPDGCKGIKTYTVFLGSNPAGGLASLGNTDVCANDSLRFTINGVSTNPPGTLYSFMINDGSASQTFLHPAPSVVGHYFDHGSCGNVSTNGVSSFDNAFGAYLTITNPCGTTSPAVVPIYVSGKPRAIISLPSPVICVNSAVTIYSTSQYGNVINQISGTMANCINSGKQVWSISPATGYTITSGNPGSLNGSPTNALLWTNGSTSFSANFTATGTYTIKLYVANDRCGMDSTVQTICVRNPPQANFTMPQKSSCTPGTLQLTNTSPVGACSGDDYSWTVRYDDPLNCNTATGTAYTFANGTTSTTASPTLQLNLTGRYIIRLTVSAKNSSYSCQPVYKEDTFYIKGVPKITINPVSAICVNNAITPTATATSCYSNGPIGYEWTFNSATPATSPDLTPGNITYNSTGTFPIQLKVTDSSCNISTTASVNVTITSKPVADAGTDRSVCSGTPVAIGSTAVNGVTYQWSPATGLSNAGISNPTLNFVYTGTASDTTLGYKLIASAGSNCASEDSVYITVKRTPVVALQPLLAQVCTGNSAQITASGADSYTWSPATYLDNTTTATVTSTPAVTTIYTVTGVLSNGCTDTAKIEVRVLPDAKAQFTAAKTRLCSPVNLDTVIKVTTAPGNGTYNWFVNGVAAGSNTTGVFPSYPVNTAGQTLVVKLVVQSAAGCKPDSMEMSFQTAANVTADFTQSKKNGCAPLDVTFTNTSSSTTGVQFFWNFGNGTTSTQIQPGTITYAASASYNDTTYYITLKAFNGCDTTYKRDSVIVYAPAKARFGVDKTEGCSPFTVKITNTSPGHYTAFYWDFGDGQQTTTYNTGSMNHIYYTGNIVTYPIRLIAENQCGKDTQTLNLLVSPSTIQPQVNVNGNQLYGCAPHTAVFNNSSVGAAQLTWNFGDNTPSIITPNEQNTVTHVFNSAGNYTITIRLQNNCTDTTITRQVTVYPSPVSSFTVDNTPVCTNYTVTTTNTAKNAQAYEWIWGDGQTSSSFNGSHKYASAGVYTIKLVAKSVNNFGVACTDTSSRQVTVIDRIIPQINVGGEQKCAPFTLRVSAGNAATAQMVQWTFYDNSQAAGFFQATGGSASYVYSIPGKYKVKMVIYTAAGCADSTNYDFEVMGTPHTAIQPINPVTCNTDTTIFFTATSQYAGTDPLQYNWMVNGKQESTSNPFVYRFNVPRTNEYRSTFTIQVSAKNAAGCGDTADAGKVTIQPLLKPSIEVTPGLVQEQPNYTFGFKDLQITRPDKIYLWDMGDATRQQKGGREITYKFGDTGSYKVKLLVTDYATGCQVSDSVKVTILHVAGYLQVPNAFCPGCSTGSLRQFLPMGKGLSQYRLRIFNSWGQLVFESTSLDGNGSPNQPWDGRVNGKPIQLDSYQWQIEARYINGTEWKGMLFPGNSKPIKSGFVTIVR